VILDHLILNVNDVEASARFYADVLGFRDEGPHPPFRMLRVSPELVLLLGPWATEGGTHLAFAMGCEEFDAVFRRLREHGVPYGDDPHAVDNGRGPHRETVEGGARGCATSLYFHDPNRHVIEIRHYE